MSIGLANRQPRPASHRRRSKSAGFDALGFFGARPGGTGVTQELQGAVIFGGELETPSCGYHQGIAWAHGCRSRGFAVSFGRAAPHLAAAFQNVPDFFHSPMPNRTGYLAGRQRDVDQAGPAGTVSLVDEKTHLGPVGRSCVGFRRSPAQWQRRLNGFSGHS